MKRDLRPVAAAMSAILVDPRASRLERVEAAKVVLSCHGCLLPDVNESFLSVREITQLRRMREDTVRKVLGRKEKKKYQNRRAYIRRKIRSMEAQQQTQALTAHEAGGQGQQHEEVN